MCEIYMVGGFMCNFNFFIISCKYYGMFIDNIVCLYGGKVDCFLVMRIVLFFMIVNGYFIKIMV